MARVPGLRTLRKSGNPVKRASGASGEVSFCQQHDGRAFDEGRLCRITAAGFNLGGKPAAHLARALPQGSGDNSAALFDDTSGLTLYEVAYSTLSLRGLGSDNGNGFGKPDPTKTEQCPGWGVVFDTADYAYTITQLHCEVREGEGECDGVSEGERVVLNPQWSSASPTEVNIANSAALRGQRRVCSL